MILQELLARRALNADVSPGVIALPAGVSGSQLVALVLCAGYNADLEFAVNTTSPRLPVYDDTGVTPEALNTFWTGPASNAPLLAYAAGTVAIEVLIFSVAE